MTVVAKQGFWIHNDSKAIPGPRKHIAVTVAAKQGFWIPRLLTPRPRRHIAVTAAAKQTFCMRRLPTPGPKRLEIAMIDALVAVGVLMCASGTNQLNSQLYDRTCSKIC